MIIRIKDLHLKTIIGVNPWERNEPQSVVITFAVDFDGAAAGASDDLADTLDYRALVKRVTEVVETSQYQLIEALATAVLNTLMADARVFKAWVELAKPHAVKTAESTIVEVTADRAAAGK